MFSQCGVQVLDELIDHLTHAPGNDQVYDCRDDATNTANFNNLIAAPRFDVGTELRRGNTVDAPDLKDSSGACTDLNTSNGCVLEVPATSSGTVEVDTYRWVVASGQGGTRNGCGSTCDATIGYAAAIQLYDSSDNLVGTITIDKDDVAEWVPIYRELLGRSGRPIYFNKANRDLATTQVPANQMFTDGATWEAPSTENSCTWGNSGCSMAESWVGDSNSYDVDEYQIVVREPENGTGAVAWFTLIDNTDTEQQNMEVLTADRFLRFKKAVGNHGGSGNGDVTFHGASDGDQRLTTPARNFGTSDAIARPEELLKFSKCQRHDAGNDDGDVDITDSGSFSQVYSDTCEGYYP
jgi:hypothetical protein